ncbi:MAG: MBL fold metallo-hydrolase [Ruminococcus sp.]|nr:MBL fold metallo-hydrolase [Ruminococcus sp.]
MKKTILKIIVILLVLLIFGVLFKYTATPHGGLTVCFIDVGQGDSAFVSADGYNILIDGGVKTTAKEVTAVLDRYGVKTLDLVIASHIDSDHIGGIARVMRNYNVNSFVTAKTDESLKGENDIVRQDLLSALNKTGIGYVSSGDRYTFDKLTVDIISPDREFGNANDDSVVAKLSYGERSFLFMGDVSSKVEKAILQNGCDINADVLKVSHHGSHSSTSGAYLSAVDPRYAVVSVSAHNSYNLPNHEVMQRLYDYGCEVLRTDESGTITVRSDGTNIDVSTEK